MQRRRALAVLAAVALPAMGCARGGGDGPDGGRVVLKHQPMWGDPAAFRALLAGFEREHPGVRVVTEALPSSSDVAHQFFLTALEGGARDFDVFVADVVWVPELARAGWVADLSAAFPPERLRGELLQGPADAAIVGGRTFAVPWYADAGVLYRRTDLHPRAPATYADLERMAAGAPGDPARGYVWQGRQYEGLVCNACEAIWGHGGATAEGDRVLVDTPEARAAIEHLAGLVARGLSPPSVTSMAEEEARRAFQEGRAALMRNWPYALAEAERAGSPVRGKVAISPLPTLSGEPGYGALGGYLLALNAHAPIEHRDAAIALIAHLTSAEASIALALAYGRAPARRAAYADPRLAAGAPAIAALLPMIERARPRPMTPYYPMISDTLQAELSAAITGVRRPAAALARAQAIIDHLTRGAP